MSHILPDATVIFTPRQTAGRGQRGNSWESEPEKNITFSMLLKNPPVEPRKQFFISEAVSLAIVDVLSKYTEKLSIKWPNDIYVADSKICGILIEHVLRSCAISHTIVGAGININQRAFLSDAPNPISLVQATGSDTDYDTTAILHEVAERIEALCRSLGDEAANAALHQRYLDNLYRYDKQFHPFVLPDGTPIQAQITDVMPEGTLVLTHSDHTQHSYAFKEVAFVI